ncbi:uncharacterized protein N7469_009561 [Penicillium citrinum]|uniref:Uncharacterized protein n=1 Tax=Penicillium citrinum TaxID=5077 RepID=A0A9W9NL10_PENCI|nr:uncharacterized protein N7469_009561 [Penicillium citrinum]KAJ5220674.1 hypothetical protein N7469_009561 [Penicillium citrinum]
MSQRRVWKAALTVPIYQKKTQATSFNDLLEDETSGVNHQTIENIIDKDVKQGSQPRNTIEKTTQHTCHNVISDTSQHTVNNVIKNTLHNTIISDMKNTIGEAEFDATTET